MAKPVHIFSSFAVKNFKKAKDFYSKTLGLSVREDKKMGMLEIKITGGNHVMVYPKPDQKPANFTILNLIVKDIDAAVTDLSKRGVKFEKYKGFKQDAKGIARDDWGPAIAWFKDPDGNIIAVFEE